MDCWDPILGICRMCGITEIPFIESYGKCLKMKDEDQYIPPLSFEGLSIHKINNDRGFYYVLKNLFNDGIKF